VSLSILSKQIYSPSRCSGNFLYNNYKQAIAIIENYTNNVEELKRTFNDDDTLFTRWKDEESKYLQELSHHPKDDILVLAYIEALQKLQVVECVHWLA
jgi:hypothetical protein